MYLATSNSSIEYIDECLGKSMLAFFYGGAETFGPVRRSNSVGNDGTACRNSQSKPGGRCQGSFCRCLVVDAYLENSRVTPLAYGLLSSSSLKRQTNLLGTTAVKLLEGQSPFLDAETAACPFGMLIDNRTNGSCNKNRSRRVVEPPLLFLLFLWSGACCVAGGEGGNNSLLAWGHQAASASMETGTNANKNQRDKASCKSQSA